MDKPQSKRVEISANFGSVSSHALVNSSVHDQRDWLPQGPRKYWEVAGHCHTHQFPQTRPEIWFDSPSARCQYERLASSGIPDQHVGKLITQAHHRVLLRLNQSNLQVKNFTLPVQLMKMKNMDPFSRQKIVGDLCKYFSFQHGLRNIVLEQAEVKFADLCRLLVAIASNSKVKNLFLWHVVDNCDKPFEGPLQSETVLDDLPRIPFTYNPGGRKYLRDLINRQQEFSEDSKEVMGSRRNQDMKTEMSHGDFSQVSQKLSHSTTRKFSHTTSRKSHTTTRKFSHTASRKFSHTTSRKMSYASRNMSRDSNTIKAESKNVLTQLGKLEDIVIKCLTDSNSDNMTCKIIRKELAEPVVPANEEHVFSQNEVGIQCTISQDLTEEIKVLQGPEVAHVYHINPVESTAEVQTDDKSRALRSVRLRFCENYLKYYKNSKISSNVLREMYMIALNNLTYLTQLAVNYSMLADGIGTALLSIGSLMNGKLKHLKLLCEPDDIPSPIHQVYDDNALQAIPDLIWHTVALECPDLNVHIVIVSMSAYDVTKRFVTKSMPLSSFHMDNGFCPNLGYPPNHTLPQLTIFCTLKCLWLDHADTLENVSLTLWHTTGNIDSSLENLIQKTNLHSFAYYGPFHYKATVSNLCDAALESSKMKNFKLMIQGDPCYSDIAREHSSNCYNDYRQRFQEKSIQFTLGTFNC